jgi:hypothetical protein
MSGCGHKRCSKYRQKWSGLLSGRKSALDGHLVGSSGEVLAAYYYDLDLLPPSTERHDDATTPDGRLVQIKATQGMHNITMRSELEHLIGPVA